VVLDPVFHDFAAVSDAAQMTVDALHFTKWAKQDSPDRRPSAASGANLRTPACKETNASRLGPISR